VSESVDEVRDLLEQCADLPYGPSQVSRIDEIIRYADSLGDRRLRFDARMVGSDAYTFGGEPAKAFVTFSWCLTEFDRHPELFNDWDDEQLRWHYKWIISALRDFPEIPLARTASLLEDMERRYRLGGHSQHAVYALRWRLARHVGDTSAADEWYERWCAAPRDENSDCEGCDPTSKVEHLVERGRDDEAIALAEPVLAGQLTCHQQPHSMLTELMIPYLRTGQFDKARQAHLRGYRGFRDRLADLVEIAQHIEFCGLTGNEARGLELIERHLDWLDRAPSPRSAMRFAAAAGLVLCRLVAAGRGDLTIYRRAAGERSAGDVAVAVLAEELSAVARAQAARFDERNGTTHCSEEVERRLGADRIVEYLPLSAVARAGGGHSTTAAAWAARSESLAAAVAAELPAEIDLDGLLVFADQAYWVLDDDQRALTLWSIVVQRFAGRTLSGRQRAQVLEAMARVALYVEHDPAAAEQPLAEAVGRYRDEGDEVAARLAETWLGSVRCQLGQVPDAISLIVAAVEWLRDSGEYRAVTRGELRLAESLAMAGRLDEAVAAVERARATAEADPAVTIGVRIDLTASCLALWTGQFPLASQLARQSIAESTRLRRRDLVGLSQACLGYALDNAGDEKNALEAYDFALGECTDERLYEQLQSARAHLLAGSSRAAEAVDPLVEIVAKLVASGSESEAATAQFDLAIAYHAAGQLLDAAETAETAVRALEAVGQPAEADRCRYRLSKIYVDLDEAELALAMLDELVGRLDGYDNLPIRAQVHEDAARILFASDRDAVAAARFALADECFLSADLPHDALRARRARAVALSWTDDVPEQSLLVLEQADHLASILPADDPATVYELAMLDADAARVLANLGRASDAVERLATVPARLRAIDAYGEALDAELLTARLLLGLDQVTVGERLLRSVVASSPTDSPVHRSAAWSLIAVLEETGRAEEATTLRTTYGVTETMLVDEDDDDEDDGDDDR
jgi:tetratricopeptide (TPR) repeat protein